MNTAVILAGGASRRMGRDKPALLFEGKTFLQGAVERFSAVFDKVYVSVADGAKYPEVTAQRVVDAYPGCGPMAGLHAALLACEGEGVFLVAADLPFSDPSAALRLIELAGDEYDVCLTKDADGRFEPLFAYYKKTLLPAVEALLRGGRYKMIALFDSAKVRVVTPEELGENWDDKTLLNVNYYEEYQRLTDTEKNSFVST